MADRRPRAVLTALAALAAVGSAPAQGAELVVELAPDPQRSGPPAWTWARERALPRLAGAGAERPLEALRLRIDSGGDVAVTAGVPLAAGIYAAFDLRSGGVRLARGTCTHDGTESWQVVETARSAELPDPLRRLLSRFAYEARTGWLSVDLATATGNLVPAAAERDPLGELLTLGAVECGTVTVVAREGPHGSLEIHGRSGGGIALPALLVALADAQAGRPPTDAALADDVERWLLLAASAQAEEQEEAARQLSRFDDPRARRALEQLLHHDGRVRLVAMHGLMRLGALDSVGAIAAAADPSVPGSVEVAARAIVTLAPPDVRDALVAEFGMTVPLPAPLGETAPAASVPAAWHSRWLVLLAAGITIGAVGFAAGQRRRHG